MSAEWQHGLFGCFDNFGVCILSFVAPCYVFGKSSEAIGESCIVHAIAYMVPIANIIAAFVIRGMIRERKGIPGTKLKDLAVVVCCPFCGIAQEAQEVQNPNDQYMTRE